MFHDRLSCPHLDRMEVVENVVQSSTRNTMNMDTFTWMITPILLFAGIILIIIGFLIVFGVMKTNVPSNSSKLQLQLDSAPYSQTTGFPYGMLQGNQQYLVNFSPLTGYLAGYIGPVKQGSFDPNLYLSSAFKAGIRSFVLPISTYNDNNKTPDSGWPYSGEPAVVCRDASGTIISNNGMSIRDFVNSILQNRGVNSYYANDPIYLHLEEVSDYVPDPVKEEKRYVIFMSKIASQLSALDGMRIVSMPDFGQLGSLVGGERERELLTFIPVTYFFGRIIITTNFKTRLSFKTAYQNLQGPKLHEYVNFIYKPFTSGDTSSNHASKSIPVIDLIGSPINWPSITQTTTLLAQPEGLDIPDLSTVNSALKQGIQIIPLPFFYQKVSDTKALYNLWKGASAIVKPVASPDDNLFTRPDPVVPAKPSEMLNARVNPNQQPGQVNVI